jgi:hypothetical protein
VRVAARSLPLTIEFKTEPNSPYVDVLQRVPVMAKVTDNEGGGEVLLFVDANGQLDTLEYVTFDGSMPSEMPPAAKFAEAVVRGPVRLSEDE